VTWVFLSVTNVNPEEYVFLLNANILLYTRIWWPREVSSCLHHTSNVGFAVDMCFVFSDFFFAV